MAPDPFIVPANVLDFIVDAVGSLPGSIDVLHRTLVHRDAFARDRGLIDAGRAFHQKAVCGQSLIRTDDDDVADFQFLDWHLDRLPVASNHGHWRRQFGESLDRVLGPAHRVVLERMTEAEQGQKERTLCKGADGCGARSGHEHQGIDLEAPLAEIVPGFPDRKEAAKEVGDHKAGRQQPFRRCSDEIFEYRPGNEKAEARQCEDHFGIGAKEIGMPVIVPITFLVVMGFARLMIVIVIVVVAVTMSVPGMFIFFRNIERLLGHIVSPFSPIKPTGSTEHWKRSSSQNAKVAIP